MKSILLAALFLTALHAARADYVIKQKVESPMQTGDVTMDIKGDKIRVDMSAGAAGPISTIIDVNTGDSVNLLHKPKMMMKMSGAQMKERMEDMQKRMNSTNTVPPKLKDTGKTETVGGYKAKIYAWTNAATGTGGTVWMTTDFPNYEAVKKEMEKMTGSPLGKMSKGMVPDTASVPGIEIKSVTDTQAGQVTTTLISAEQKPVAASLFTIPSGYHEMVTPGSAPTMKPGAAPAK